MVFVTLGVLYFIEIALLGWMMVPVTSFHGQATEYIDLLFMSESIFEKYGLNKLDFTFSFLFMMQWMVWLMIYNKRLLEAKDYACFTMHRYGSKRNYLLSLVKDDIVHMGMYGLIEMVVVCMVLGMMPTITLFCYLMVRHAWLGIFRFIICVACSHGDGKKRYAQCHLLVLMLLVVDMLTPMSLITIK